MPTVRRSFAVAGLAGGLFLSVGSLMGGSPGPNSPAPPPAATPAVPVPPPGGTPPVAYIYGTTPVTQDELCKFLMDRGGAEKLELYVNKRIIEAEAAKRGVTVTKLEMEAALLDDCAGLPGNISKADFVKYMLPRYGKTYFEWMEDVIRPRLLLGKMCRDRVTVKEEDLRTEFERRHGEKRRCQMLMWPKGDDEKLIRQRYANANKGQAEFDSEALNMVNPDLKATKGHMKPISRYLVAEDKQVEAAAFSLQVGQVSNIMNTPMGYVVIKLHEIIPPNAAVKFEDERPALHKVAFEDLLTKEIPVFFAELKKAAQPRTFYTAPTDWRTTGSFLDAVPDIINPVGSSRPAPAPQPNPPVSQTPSGLPPVK